MSVKKVGELLVDQGLITAEQRMEALELQKVFPDQPIGQLLCKLGFIKESDLSFVLDQKNKRRRLSDILLSGGLVDHRRSPTPVKSVNRVTFRWKLPYSNCAT